MTPEHLATKAAIPRNSLNTGGAEMSSSPLSFKITLGGSPSAPCLSAWTEESSGGGDGALLSVTGKNMGIPTTGPNMKAAGGSVFFGSRPMWAASSDKKRKQSAYKGQQQASPQQGLSKPGESKAMPISLRSPAEEALVQKFGGDPVDPVKDWKRRFQATPETLTPASSRAASSGGSAGSGKRRSPVLDNNAALEATMISGVNPAMTQSLSGLTTGSFLTKSMTSSWQSHCKCYGEGVTDAYLVNLPARRGVVCGGFIPGALDQMIKTARIKGELCAGNIHKGSKGTMLGA